jgi:hypothetical protein
MTAITFDALVTRIKITLNDKSATTWDTEMIATFLNDAIRDYSNHFPKQESFSLPGVTGTLREWDLPIDFFRVISVEHPDGEDPPIFFKRRPYTHPFFFQEERYYDIRSNHDDDDPSQIIFSQERLTGSTSVIEYHAHHTLIADTALISGDCTVPPHHQHLLTHFCRWQASLHLASAEQQSPTSNSSLLMAQLAQNARRDALTYSTAVQQALWSADGESQPRNWTEYSNAGVERIY